MLEVALPALQVAVDLFDHHSRWLEAVGGCRDLSDRFSRFLERLLGRDNVQIPLVPSMNILVISEGETQKV